MTFQQLVYVVEIAKCGSINQAAHKLFLSQSGISAAVRELEAELGITLFSRSNRGVEFTLEGKEFLSYAISLIDQKRRIESLYGDAGSDAAPVRLSVSTQRYPFTEDAFLRLLRETEARRYRLSIREGGLDAVIEDVYRHRADVGVIFRTEMNEKLVGRLLDARALEFFELAAVAPCVYLGKNHPLAGRGSVMEEDLTGYPYLSFEHGQGEAVDFSEEYQVLSFQKPARCINVSNRTTAMNVVATTDAFTTGSGLMAEALADPRVVTLPLAGESRIHLGWVQGKHARLSPLAERFVALLQASVADSVRFTQREQERFRAGR